MCDPQLGVAAQSAIWDTEHQTGESHNMFAQLHPILWYLS